MYAYYLEEYYDVKQPFIYDVDDSSKLDGTPEDGWTIDTFSHDGKSYDLMYELYDAPGGFEGFFILGIHDSGDIVFFYVHNGLHLGTLDEVVTDREDLQKERPDIMRIMAEGMYKDAKQQIQALRNGQLPLRPPSSNEPPPPQVQNKPLWSLLENIWKQKRKK